VKQIFWETLVIVLGTQGSSKILEAKMFEEHWSRE